MNETGDLRFSPRRSTQLRVFFSVDLVSGTEYKNRELTPGPISGRGWPDRFERFFQEFIRSFKERVGAARVGTVAEIIPPPHLWKVNGDELLFTELVFEDPEQRHAALRSSLRAFVDLVHDTDEEYIAEGLGVRACAWTAGFPLRNKTVQVIQGGVPLIAGDAGRSDPDTGPTSHVPVTVNDYIGRDMDIGFRLAAGAPPGRIVCSLDLAHFVFALPDSDLTVWHVGWSPLKGVLNQKPYPLLWLDDRRDRRARNPWDESDNAHANPEVRRFLDVDEPLSQEKFDDLAGKVRALSAGQLIVPYASLKEMPEDHRAMYLKASGVDPTRELRAEIAEHKDDPDFAVSAGHAETITLDELNQLLFWLQDRPERVAEVRDILREVGRQVSYRAWIDRYQYEGGLFRLDPDLAFATTERRYLLESLFLVKNDALRVKVNLCGDQAFITDGLWVDPSIRAFPFSDESDLVIRGCEESGLMGWATTVIDPATGCGHNLLRYKGEGCQRHGFDRNARSLAYAGINAILNEVEQSTFAANDIRGGIPPVFAQSAPERVLVLANMPFALVPNHDTIARSADGGRHGYELTLALLDAFDGLADQLDEASGLCGVVLTYTVGSRRSGRWAVPDYAVERFGEDAVRWKLCSEERLWRVNGRKEERNPMPLTHLRKKADCRFYVRGDITRDALRDDYEELTAQLANEGYEDLAYGFLVIRHPRRSAGFGDATAIAA
jgi:methylase of polypeptide subunit release factors